MSETTNRGRGRPAVGDVLAVRLPADQRATVERAGQPGEKLAETARRLLAIGAAFEPADWRLIADALTARADAHKRTAASRSLTGPRFADARKAHHEQAAHLTALAERAMQASPSSRVTAHCPRCSITEARDWNGTGFVRCESCNRPMLVEPELGAW